MAGGQEDGAELCHGQRLASVTGVKEGYPVGLTFLQLEIGNPGAADATERVELLIDSGAVYSVVPTPILGSGSV